METFIILKVLIKSQYSLVQIHQGSYFKYVQFIVHHL